MKTAYGCHLAVAGSLNENGPWLVSATGSFRMGTGDGKAMVEPVRSNPARDGTRGESSSARILCFGGHPAQDGIRVERSIKHPMPYGMHADSFGGNPALNGIFEESLSKNPILKGMPRRPSSPHPLRDGIDAEPAGWNPFSLGIMPLRGIGLSAPRWSLATPSNGVLRRGGSSTLVSTRPLPASH